MSAEPRYIQCKQQVAFSQIGTIETISMSAAILSHVNAALVAPVLIPAVPPKILTPTPPKTKLIPWTDGGGTRHWVAVEADTARELSNYDRWARERDELFRRNHKITRDPVAYQTKQRARTAAKAIKVVGYLNCELEPASAHLRLPRGGEPWAGPRFTFTILLGSSLPWWGQDDLWVRDAAGAVTCRFCGRYGETLPPYAVCLNPECCRSGHDDELAAALRGDGSGALPFRPQRKRRKGLAL